MAEQTCTLAVGAQVTGTVRHLGIYGAMVDIGTGQDALLHISQLSREEERKFEEVVRLGCEITAYVYKMREDGYVALTMDKPPAVPWRSIKRGNIYVGKVIRIEDFGVFVDFGAERPGMVHVSEMADGFVKSPGDVVSLGQEVEVRVIKKNGSPRKIDLSMKPAVEEVEIEDEEEEEDVPTAMAQAFQRAMRSDEVVEAPESRPENSRASHRDKQEEILQRTLRNAQAVGFEGLAVDAIGDGEEEQGEGRLVTQAPGAERLQQEELNVDQPHGKQPGKKPDAEDDQAAVLPQE